MATDKRLKLSSKKSSQQEPINPDQENSLKNYSTSDGTQTLVMLKMYAEELSHFSTNYELNLCSQKLERAGFYSNNFQQCLKQLVDKLSMVLIDCPTNMNIIISNVDPSSLGKSIRHAITYGTEHGARVATYDVKTVANNIAKIATDFSSEIQNCDLKGKVLLECAQSETKELLDKIVAEEKSFEIHSTAYQENKIDVEVYSQTLEKLKKFPNLTYTFAPALETADDKFRPFRDITEQIKQSGVIDTVWKFLVNLFDLTIGYIGSPEIFAIADAALFYSTDAAIGMLRRLDKNCNEKQINYTEYLQEKLLQSEKKKTAAEKSRDDSQQKLQEFTKLNETLSANVKLLEHFIEETNSLCLMWKSAAHKFNKVKESLEKLESSSKQLTVTQLTRNQYEEFKRKGTDILIQSLRIAADAELYREVYKHFQLERELANSVQRLLQPWNKEEKAILPLDERIEAAKRELKGFEDKFNNQWSDIFQKKKTEILANWDKTYQSNILRRGY